MKKSSQPVIPQSALRCSRLGCGRPLTKPWNFTGAHYDPVLGQDKPLCIECAQYTSDQYRPTYREKLAYWMGMSYPTGYKAQHMIRDPYRFDKKGWLWYQAALSDGWERYSSESENGTAWSDLNDFHLRKLGWIAGINVGWSGVYVYGPEKPAGTLEVEVSYPYDWQTLQDNLTLCMYCKQHVSPDQITRIGFAGRCCKDCRAEYADKVEYTDWVG